VKNARVTGLAKPSGIEASITGKMSAVPSATFTRSAGTLQKPLQEKRIKVRLLFLTPYCEKTVLAPLLQLLEDKGRGNPAPTNMIIPCK